MIPAMAYSIEPLLESFRGSRKAPEQNKECDGNRDIQQIQHGHLELDEFCGSESTERI